MSPQAPSRVAESKEGRAQRVLMFWFEMKLPREGSMVRTFIPHVLPMTVDCKTCMLHGDTQPQLGLEQQLLTGQAQRNIRQEQNDTRVHFSPENISNIGSQALCSSIRRGIREVHYHPRPSTEERDKAKFFFFRNILSTYGSTEPNTQQNRAARDHETQG